MSLVRFCLLGVFVASFINANPFLKELDDYAFVQKKTKSLIIQHKGKIVYEKYASNWSPEKPHLLWSMSKSIINQLIGIAVYEGRLTLEESICNKIAELKGSKHCKITVDDVLSFASGIRWNEVYEDSIVESSPISQLYGKNPKGMLSFILNSPHDLKEAPGTLAMYSSGDTMILSELLKRAYPPASYAHLPWKKWANKIGITSLVFERDSQNTFVGSSYAYLTARDTLKWGNMLRDNGVVNGERILPKWWMDYSTQLTKAYLKGRVIRDADEMMSRQWWINKEAPQIGLKKAWKYIPSDAYAASGHWGQVLMMVPSEDLIVVRYGEDKDSSFKKNDLMRYVLQYVHNNVIPETTTPTGNPELVTEHFDSGLSYERDLWIMPKTRTEISLFSGYKAKEYCSCVYVTKRSDEDCKEFVKNKAVPSILVPLRHDTKRKIVSVNSSHAYFVNESYGCSLYY